MLGIRVNSSWLRALLVLFFVGTTLELVTTEAAARAGRGRSSGRPSNYGSRQQPQSQPQAAPNQFGNQNSGVNPNRGGFLRGMAGGIAGGFLGSMLFSSFGHAAGGLGGAGGGGGIGLFEILLFAALAYFGFRWWKSRQQATATSGGITQRYGSPPLDLAPSPASGVGGNMNVGQFRALAPVGIDAEAASDIFFKIQGAWTRRDVSSVRSLLGSEMRETLERDITELKQNQQTNRLENITVRRTEVTSTWEDGGTEYSSVRFAANLLDYTVNDTTGQIVEGSDTQPVRFEEDWTFSKTGTADSWQLVGIQQM